MEEKIYPNGMNIYFYIFIYIGINPILATGPLRMLLPRPPEKPVSKPSPSPSTTLSSTLAAQIRADIIQGLLPPGSKLRTKELSERYGTSLIPMREALSRLASSGFVQAEDQRGFRVAEVSANELADITRTRLFIEQEALRRSLENGDLAWEASLIAAHHRLSRLPMQLPNAPGIAPDWEEAHTAFHRTLLSACDSQWLLNLAEMLRDQSARYRHLSVQHPPSASTDHAQSSRDVAGEHQALLDAALRHDVNLATTLLAQHFQTTSDLVLQPTPMPQA